jgi:hypothetical protein
MGATTFTCEVEGNTASQAFRAAKEQAQYEYGHDGYTGTIAEKSSFIMMECPAGVDLYTHVYALLDSHQRISDTWGPAGCIKLAESKWLFFGWASC